MVKFLKKTGLCAMTLFLFACGDSDLLKFDNLEGVKNWEPDYKLQLAYANYDVWKLIERVNNGDSTVIEKDNQIFIRHFQKDIASLDAGEVINLPEDINFTIEVPEISSSLSKDSVVILSETAVPIGFREGSLTKVYGTVTCQNESYPSPFKLKIDFTNVKVGSDTGAMFSFSPLNGGTVMAPQQVVFDMTAAPNQLKYKASIVIPQGQIISKQNLKIGIRMKDFSFTRVEGTMKTRNVEIDEGEFNMDVEFWNHFAGSFNFANPRVDLIVRNYGLGVPVQMDMNFVAYGENGKHVSLETKDNYKPEFKGWIPDGGEVADTQSYNVNNSNISELLSLPPKEKITYGGQIIVSPDPIRSLTLLNTGKASVDAYVEIPFHLSAKKLIFRDTIDDIDISDADKIKKAEIVIIADNQIPLELGSGYLYLLDEAKNCIDSVKIERFLDAPEVDDNGNVIPSEEEKEVPPIVLSEENILHLEDTKFMVISVEATTSNGGEKPVVIKADAMMKLKLILGAKLNLEDVF